MKHHNLYFLICCCLILFSTLSCSNENSTWKTQSRESILAIINHPVKMPDSIPIFYPDESSYRNLMGAQGKIIFNVDIDCSACLAKFKYWEKFASTFEQKYDRELPILAVIESSNLGVKNIDAIKSVWNRRWIYDPNGDFSFDNELDDDRLQAILLDSNDTIRLVGSPLFNEKLAEMYEEAILKYLR